jgi:3-oxoadipate enol-lactonase
VAFVRRKDGARIWWEASGPPGAPSVTLVMGLGYPAAMWWRQLPALTAHWRVILIDNRGAGRTGDVVGAPYSIETMAADVLAVLDAARVQATHLVGFSMGGMIAQELSLTHPERVRSLALLATHSGARHSFFLPEARSLLSARTGMTAHEAAEVAIPFNYAPTTDRSLIEEDWAVRLPLASTPAGFAAQMTGGMRWSSLRRLPHLRPPLMVLHGQEDRLIPVSNGRLIASAVRDSALCVVRGANHLLTTDRADEVNVRLLAWFETNR